MAERYYDPWDALRRLQDEVGRALGDYGQGETAATDNSRVVTSAWSPAVDIAEEPGRFVLYADLPGVDVKNIDITMEDGVLTIKGERVPETEGGKGSYKRVERRYGTFYRRFSLPDSADADAIKATGKNGVLEISIPKAEKAQPKRIRVSG